MEWPEHDFLQVIHALMVWHCYVKGVSLWLVTDHNENIHF
jgi:hypothetical protein